MDISWVQMAASASLGALIGYSTNFLAIKSLFRPLQPRWYSLGWQGVIPRNRHRLANNIARVVGRDLLARDYLLEQLQHPILRHQLDDFTTTQLARGLDLSWADLWARLPDEWRGPGLDALAARLLEGAAAWSEGPDGEQLRNQIIAKLEQGARALSLADVVSQDHMQEAVAALGRSLGNSQPALAKLVQARLRAWLEANQPLEDVLPEELRLLLHQQLRRQVPLILRRVAEWLQDPDNVENLSDQIFSALKDNDGDNFWGYMIAQVGVRVFRQQIRRAIEERLPEAAYDYLHSEETRGQIEERLIRAIDTFLQRPVGDMFGEQAEELADQVGEIAATWLSSARMREQIGDLLLDWYGRQADFPMDQWVPEGLWTAGRQRLAAALRLSPERAAAWRQPLGDWLRQRLAKNRTPLRRWLGLGSQTEASLAAWLQERAMQLLQREVPALVEHFDVEDLVRAKIDSYDLLRVERLIKNIISDQLRYINLLGGVLGGIVGLLLPFLNAWIAALGG